MDHIATDCEDKVRNRLGLYRDQPITPEIEEYIRAACRFGLPDEGIASHVARMWRWPTVLKKIEKEYPSLFSQMNTQADLKACFLLHGAGGKFLRMVVDYVISSQRHADKVAALQAKRATEAQQKREQAWEEFLKECPPVQDVYFLEEILVEFEVLDPNEDDLKRQLIQQWEAENARTPDQRLSGGLNNG